MTTNFSFIIVSFSFTSADLVRATRKNGCGHVMVGQIWYLGMLGTLRFAQPT